jgi:metallo-beta-lactamase class B
MLPMITRAMLLVLLGPLVAVEAQQSPAPRPRFDTAEWVRRTEPLRIAGSIHYVGTRELGSFLITTSAGHILLDGVLRESAPGVADSIRQLGFRPEDIRILLISQAHFDHVGSLAYFKRLTGARVEVMAGDERIVESGGTADYLFANEPSAHFEPVKVDRVLHDGDEVRLGDVRLTARHTPGHTPGCTTWVTTVVEGGKRYSVVFPGSTTINPGTRLVHRPSYPGIQDDYRRTFAILDTLRPDIFLAAHASFFDLEARRGRQATEGVRAFVDPDGYRQLMTVKKAAFERYVAEEAASH